MLVKAFILNFSNKLNRMKKILFTAVIVFLGSQIGFAQSYLSDRPGIGNGSFITPKKMLGLESGVQYSNTEMTDQFDIGQLLLRYGLSNSLEVRASLGSYSRLKTDLRRESSTFDGFQDIGLGLKYNLISGNGLPTVSALAEVSLPVGSEYFTNEDTVPSVGLLADYSLTDQFAIASNIGYSFTTENVNDSWLFTITPGFSITNTIGGFVGYAGNYFDGYEQHWVEGGFTVSLENGVQLDGNFGYDTENDIVFLGAGFAVGL